MKVISVSGRKRTISWLRFGVLLGLLVPLMNAQAAEVIDEVKATVDNINERTKNINTKVTDIKDQTNLIAPIQSTVGDIQTSLQDLPSTIQETIGVNIDPEMKDEILDVIAILRANLDQKAADLASFGDGSPGTGCYDFRTTMKTLSRDLIDTMFLLESIGGSSIPEPPTDRIEAALALIDVLDCKFLLPAWLGLSNGPVTGFDQILTTIPEDLRSILPLFDANLIASSSAQLQAEKGLPSEQVQAEVLNGLIISKTCTYLDVSNVNRRKEFEDMAIRLKADSIILQVEGSILKKDAYGGELKAPLYEKGDKEVGIHGYGSLTLERQKDADYRIGQAYEILGKIVGAIADYVSHKVETCIDVRNQEVIFTELCELSRYRSDACQELLLASP
jgi:hypothetical protein